MKRLLLFILLVFTALNMFSQHAWTVRSVPNTRIESNEIHVSDPDGYLSDSAKNFRRMLWLRTVPLFPYDVISLVAGCTKMRVMTFSVTTLLGILPGAVAFNVVGDAMTGNSGLLFSGFLLAVAFGIPLTFWYCGGERKNLKSAEQSE